MHFGSRTLLGPMGCCLFALLASSSCVTAAEDDCEEGTRGCPCARGGCKLSSLSCIDDLCVRAGENGGASAGGATGSGGTTGGVTESGGASGTGNASTGPSCTDLRIGTQNATHGEIASCRAEVQSFQVSIGPGGLVQTINGQSCTLSMRGSSCYDVFPDVYQCGACSFDVQAFSTSGTAPEGWFVNVSSCSDACAQYCCTMDSEIRFASDYYLDQTPAGSGGSGSGGAGGSTGGTNPRDPCAGCGFPFCDGNCAGCC